MTFVILTGGIDLSVGSVVALSTLMLAPARQARLAAVARDPSSCSLIGSTLGLVDGLLSSTTSRSSRSSSPWPGCSSRADSATRSPSTPISITKPGYVAVAQHTFNLPGDLYVTTGVVVALVVVARSASYVLHYTRLGRNVYAIGGNEQSALLMGLPVGPDEDRRLHDQRLLLGARRRAALVLHAVRLRQPRGRHGARRDRRGRHRRHAADRRHRLPRSAPCSACSSSA